MAALPRFWAYELKSSSLLNKPRNPDQDHCAKDGDQYARDEAATTAATEQANNPASNESADDAQQNVSDHTVSAALHDFSSRPACNQTDHNPPDDSVCHTILLEFSRALTAAAQTQEGYGAADELSSVPVRLC